MMELIARQSVSAAATAFLAFYSMNAGAAHSLPAPNSIEFVAGWDEYGSLMPHSRMRCVAGALDVGDAAASSEALDSFGEWTQPVPPPRRGDRWSFHNAAFDLASFQDFEGRTQASCDELPAGMFSEVSSEVFKVLRAAPDLEPALSRVSENVQNFMGDQFAVRVEVDVDPDIADDPVLVLRIEPLNHVDDMDATFEAYCRFLDCFGNAAMDATGGRLIIGLG